MNGDAEFIGDDCYRLTEAINTQNGTVWYAEQLDLNDPFDFSFTMNFGTNDSQGADGIVFVLQTVGTGAIGESGGGIGFLGFNPSFGVEFDTWTNGDFGDLIADHIAMISNGDVNHNGLNAITSPIQASGGSINIED
ncbi:MAG: L-type lectin-domain containing protein, partial [Bacteroidota bacterium]